MDTRDLVVTDIAAATALWTDADLTRPWNDPGADIRRALAGEHSTVLGCFDGEDLVATAMVGEDGHRGWIYYVAVARDLRGRRLGARMITAAEDWLAERGAVKVQLMVRHGNAEAAGFYEHLGYTDSGVSVLAKWLPGHPA